MSRSRKKFPVFKDNDGAGKKKRWKKASSRKFRRASKVDEDVTRMSPKEYHRMVDSSDICDYRVYLPEYKDKNFKHRYKIFMK